MSSFQQKMKKYVKGQENVVYSEKKLMETTSEKAVTLDLLVIFNSTRKRRANKCKASRRKI